jgi:L-threonylcarbamoyladenylate synthase
MLTSDDAATFERCMAGGGTALFPADTVYGLACDPSTPAAVDALYALKGRPPIKPSAVLFFSLELALSAMPELPERLGAAMEALLPGAVTLLLPNPQGRYPLACGEDVGTLGLRVPALPPAAAALHAVRWPVLQSSANLTGAADAHRVADVPVSIRAGVDLVLDAGPLPGQSSTIIDLRAFAQRGEWTIARQGRVQADHVQAALGEL